MTIMVRWMPRLLIQVLQHGVSEQRMLSGELCLTNMVNPGPVNYFRFYGFLHLHSLIFHSSVGA
jgi:hypothetical protein